MVWKKRGNARSVAHSHGGSWARPSFAWLLPVAAPCTTGPRRGRRSSARGGPSPRRTARKPSRSRRGRSSAPGSDRRSRNRSKRPTIGWRWSRSARNWFLLRKHRVGCGRSTRSDPLSAASRSVARSVGSRPPVHGDFSPVWPWRPRSVGPCAAAGDPPGRSTRERIGLAEEGLHGVNCP